MPETIAQPDPSFNNLFDYNFHIYINDPPQHMNIFSNYLMLLCMSKQYVATATKQKKTQLKIRIAW